MYIFSIFLIPNLRSTILKWVEIKAYYIFYTYLRSLIMLHFNKIYPKE